MPPSRGPTMTMNIDVSLCGGVPRSRLASLSMRSGIVSRNGYHMSMNSETGNEPTKTSTKRDGEETQKSEETQNKEKAVEAEKRLRVLVVPAANSDHNNHRGSVTTPSPASTFETDQTIRSGAGPEAQTHEENAKANISKQGTIAPPERVTIVASSAPSAAASPTVLGTESPVPSDLSVAPTAQTPKSTSVRSSMLTISSALCNDNFSFRRDAGKADSVPNKARYQERFAPLRPSERGQVEALRMHGRDDSNSSEVQRSSAPPVEPPSWAVPASGEAKLEPVCESRGVQDSVDLTSRPFFRVGRSPSSDVQLLHATSSRRHAVLFHHPNGSCYVVDCGSAHGTYVNGIRVPGPSPHCAGMVVPHRVRKGALVRFGGPGAPCFVLKSFAVAFESLVESLGLGADKHVEDDRSALTEGNTGAEVPSYFPPPPTIPSLGKEVTAKLGAASSPRRHRSLLRSLSKAAEDPSSLPKADDTAESVTALVQLNTRLNALGGASNLHATGQQLAWRARARLFGTLGWRTTTATRPTQPHKRPRIVSDSDSVAETGSKRSRMEAETVPGQEEDVVDATLLSPKATQSLVMVSPLQSKVPLSPNLGSLPPPPFLLSQAPTPLQLRETITIPSGPAFALERLLIPSSGDMEDCQRSRGEECKGRRVRFSDEAPQLFYPPSVTPDELSSDEWDDDSFAMAPAPSTTPRGLMEPTTPRAILAS